MKCKDSLQTILKPSNYSAIVPWMQRASEREKREIVQLGQFAAGRDEYRPCSPGRGPRAAAFQPNPDDAVVVNRNGRPRLAKAIPVTGDRAQVDLMHNRNNSDKKDVDLQRRRQFFNGYSNVPNVDSVKDCYLFQSHPVVSDESAQMLTEAARRGLQRWQLRGPEEDDGRGAASAVRALRSLHKAVGGLPRFAEQGGPNGLVRSYSSPGLSNTGNLCTNSLFEFSKVVPKGHRILRPKEKRRSMASQTALVHAASAPANLRPFVEPTEVSRISDPGGYRVSLSDNEPVQMMKNKENQTKSKIPISGGQRDWSTSCQVIGQHRTGDG